MYTLNEKAAAVLSALTANLEPGQSRRIDNAPGVFMRVCVERLHGNVYSVAHYYEQNGDLVCDPDMTFWWTPKGTWCPLTFEQGGVCYRVGVELNDSGTAPARWRERECREQAAFANTWMRNIREQQGL